MNAHVDDVANTKKYTEEFQNYRYVYIIIDNNTTKYHMNFLCDDLKILVSERS